MGSRDYPTPKQVIDFVNSLPLDTIIVSGGARGVDRIAVEAADRRGMSVQVFHAEWDKYGKSAGMIRNQYIVDYADSITAFWDGISKGTANTIERAKRARKPVTVVTPA